MAYQNNSPSETLVPKINTPTFGSKIAGWNPILAALPVPLIGWMKASLGGSSKGPVFAIESDRSAFALGEGSMGERERRRRERGAWKMVKVHTVFGLAVAQYERHVEGFVAVVLQELG